MIRPSRIYDSTLAAAAGKNRRPRVIARHPRRGSLLLEITMATLLLMIAMSLTVRVLGWVGHERRASERRQRAVIEVSNAMERLTAYPYARVNSELSRKLTLETRIDRSLPDAEWTSAIIESEPEPGRAVKRITLGLRWTNRQLDWESPVRLTTWIERRRTEP
jgi:hypothetical protein